jgi:hypothetical protein
MQGLDSNVFGLVVTNRTQADAFNAKSRSRELIIASL